MAAPATVTVIQLGYRLLLMGSYSWEGYLLFAAGLIQWTMLASVYGCKMVGMLECACAPTHLYA